MNGPELVCAGCGHLTTLFKPVCDRCMAAAGQEAMSWVLRNKATGEVICETFDLAKVKLLNTAKYEAVPIQEYLASLNKPTSYDMLEDLKSKVTSLQSKGVE
jgi:hypothetical protein